MESKRKVSGANGLETTADTDRAAKRRKLIEEYGDLANGETSESTTAYGLSILESIRATTDKNGRAVSPYFETLPSRSENPQYYKKIRLPLSLEIIERKLKDKQYATLSSLESDFKRLVSNAKETNDRSSTIFGDAERVRKAVSNLMVKHNPAYKAGNYQAVPTPLPPTPEPEDADDQEELDDEVDGETTAQAIAEDVEPPQKAGADDAEAEEEGGEGERERDENEEADDDGDEGQEDEEEEEGENDEDSQPRRRRGSSWRKADPRPSRDSATPGRKAIQRTGKADHYYENISFSQLNFQQAQEKLIEELIRKKEDPDDYPYFEPFIYLPPRTLRDYYEVIAEPLSLKALQKQVRGQHGRLEATWVSDFKSWAAFEDQASLIWKNAYHYNEDGSEIFAMAQELEETFHEFLKEAKENVPEPPQPKIKLKVPQASETPGHPKKITIHVGGKNSAAGSPAPPTGLSGDSEATRNETPVNKNPFGGASSTGTSVNLSQLDKARSMSASVGPPSPSVMGVTKTEDNVQATPVPRPQVTTTTFQHFVPVVTNVPVPTTNGLTAQYQQPPPPPPPPKRSATDILEAQKYRPHPISEGEALMPRLVITTHPSAQVENKLVATLHASMTEYQQDIVINMPVSHFRLQFKPLVASFLETEQREWKLNVMHDTARLFPSSASYERRGEPVFDVTLRYGINRLEVTLIAALPKGEKAPNGLNMEMERFVLHMNLLRH
ncbi:Bromodomain-containing protein [Xylaria bambusicola]|uniref:Bromodomain-containing protein n=1 Tax=Xylaria bambusicola TaxID=326684 RepID=UPI0020087C6C|nr:Bromodomain-containing protein [Xylaria bambusicola]KAI0517154.1 Bromodomain-containing protein [Xylaria bambusicola]